MARAHTTWTIPPPAERITPALARDWLRRVYPKLASFTALGYYDGALRPPRHREDLRGSLGGLALDALRIATACAEAVATRRVVRIRLAPRTVHRQLRTRFRRLVAFERYSSRVQPTGVRGILLASLRQMERDPRYRFRSTYGPGYEAAERKWQEQQQRKANRKRAQRAA
jgi:hypothetical protein